MLQLRHSIGFRILVTSFILLALPLLIDSFILVQKSYKHTIENAKGLVVEAAQLREIPVSQFQSLDKPLIEAFIDYLKLESHFPEEPSENLNQKLKTLADIGEFYGIFILKITDDNRYSVIASGRPEFLGRDYTKFFRINELYAPAALGKGYSSFLSIDDKTGRPYFIIAQPIYSMKEGKFIGVIALSDDITEKIQNILEPELRSYKINFAILLPSSIAFEASDPDFNLQYFLPLKPSFRQLFIEENPFAANLLPDLPLPVTHTGEYPFFEFTWKGEQHIGYINKIQGANYSLLAYASKNAIFQKPLATFFNMYSVYGIILIVGGTIAAIITAQMAKPIHSLGLVMQQIQSGEIHLRYQKDPLGFEINLLGEIFNETVNAVLMQKTVAQEERVKKETFAMELRLGEQVQRSLLTKTKPLYPHVDLAAHYIPTIEVGGDFVDVFVKEEDGDSKLVLAIADVSGKGVQACFYSLSVRNMIRTYTKEYKDIAEAMQATNNLFQLDTGDTGIFVTALCGVYDYKTKNLSYYSCGHNPGIVLRRDGAIEMLKNKGMAMGVFPVEKGEADTIKLYDGDNVVFYTDGVTEAQNEKNEFFGEERFLAALKKVRDKPVLEILGEMVEALNRFTGTAAQHDDITLLVMKIKND